MILIIVIFLSGILLGHVLKRVKHLNKFSGKIMNVLVFVLLFSLGLSVGKNETVMSNIAVIGIQSLLITFFAIAGSVGLLVLYRKTLKK